jgi:hypothetical protein
MGKVFWNLFLETWDLFLSIETAETMIVNNHSDERPQFL